MIELPVDSISLSIQGPHLFTLRMGTNVPAVTYTPRLSRHHLVILCGIIQEALRTTSDAAHGEQQIALIEAIANT